MVRGSPALGRMLGRYWLTIFPQAWMELRKWSKLADRIPDPRLRDSAMCTLKKEHLNAEGAALFATLAPWSSAQPLLRALVAFQTLYDYVDTITERRPDQRDTRQLHAALSYALDPGAARPADWYRHHPYADDGGYVTALADACRVELAKLPRYDAVAPSALRLAVRVGEVQALNHEEPRVRAVLLADWARLQRRPVEIDLRWWEYAAAASSSLGIFVLLSLAADPDTTAARAELVEGRYCVTIAALNTLLESHVDVRDDELTGDQSFTSYYGPGEAASRIPMIARAASHDAESLPHADRHRMILAGMVAFYMSEREAWLPEALATSRGVVVATGPPVDVLTRVLRVRRLL